jgi:1,2-diacylglycerol 3-beta-galactosyltransferase
MLTLSPCIIFSIQPLQFLKHHPGTEYDIVDVWTPTQVFPYTTLVSSYKHLSAHPRRWKALYHISNTRLYEIFTNVHSTLTCYQKITKQLESYDPDVVISVHPTMNYLPEKIIREIAQRRNKYVPFFTVVTDFGSGHCTWFQGAVDRMYVASDRIRKLAKRRGAKVKDENLVMSGLPIRNDFADHAEKMGCRTTEEGKAYRRNMKAALGLDPEKKVILLMGGGEGVGSLGTIAEQLYLVLRKTGVDASICVVCGRNDQLRDEFQTKDWNAFHTAEMKNGQQLSKRARIVKFIKAKGRKANQNLISHSSDVTSREGNVNVVGLGFVSNMAEYMVASDILVSKAGPGTIAEAASVGLPIMLTR